MGVDLKEGHCLVRLYAGLERGSVCICGLWYILGVGTRVAELRPLLPTTGIALHLQHLGGLRLLTP